MKRELIICPCCNGKGTIEKDIPEIEVKRETALRLKEQYSLTAIAQRLGYKSKSSVVYLINKK